MPALVTRSNLPNLLTRAGSGLDWTELLFTDHECLLFISVVIFSLLDEVPCMTYLGRI